jgi:PAS domain S-box-containing protein
VDPQIDTSAGSLGIGGRRLAQNGATASIALPQVGADATAVEAIPASGFVAAFDDAAEVDINFALVSPILRAGSLAIVAFQAGYTLLDRAEFPQNFPLTGSLHIEGIVLGLLALAASLSPWVIGRWRQLVLAACASSIAITAWIAVIDGDSDVLVAAIFLFFFGAGSVIPWSPRWQAALETSGLLALLGYSTITANPGSNLAIAWTMVISALVLSQMIAVQNTRYRYKLAEHLWALATNHRLLVREMELRAAESTARERDHLRLQESETMLRRLFDANLDSMTLNTTDGTYIDVNQEFVRCTGFSREEAIGHHFAELNMWIHPDEMIAFADQLTKTNEVRNLEVAFRMKDRSERPMLLSGAMVEVYGRLCCLTISREISDLKMTQRELVAAREQALAASRAKTEFLSSMSHEIRTPMNAILGMADLLMETDLGDEQRRYLGTVISNGNALLALINSILDLAKVESGRISLEAVEFNLKDVTEKVLETLATRAHEKGLELMVRFAPGVPELVLGDPMRLGQILINLVGNAIKFTASGQVLVAVDRDPHSAAAGALKFTVTDTGIGIPADKLHLLFHAFSQADSSTSRQYGGSGLGLAIVSRLVALMHGKVAVTSEPGTGSVFSFTAQLGTATTPTSSTTRGEAIAFGGAKILLVDDNADCRSIVAELLRAQGAHVTEAATAAEAMAEISRDALRGPRFQVAVIDGAMPAVGELEVAQQIIAGGWMLPRIVMMLGSNDLTGKVGRLRALGVYNYIVKPVRRAELLAAIVRAREGVRAEPRGDKVAPAVPPPPFLDRPLKILMADDSQDNRALIRAYLKKTPYHLEEAEDGQQAIDKFIAGKFDVVLMDIQMPIVDGYEATTAIRGWERKNNRRRTPIVALTASALEEAVHRSKAAGCDAHVTKPVKRSTLLEAIHDAIEKTPPASEPVAVSILKEETCRTE